MPQAPPGQSFGPNGGALPPRPGFAPPSNGMPQQQGAPPPFDSNANAVDDLISSVVKESEARAANGSPAPEAVPEKKSKKSEKNTRFIYGDNETSPEEKMAMLPRYAFSRPSGEDVVLGDVGGAVAGVVTGPDTVLDQAS